MFVKTNLILDKISLTNHQSHLYLTHQNQLAKIFWIFSKFDSNGRPTFRKGVLGTFVQLHKVFDTFVYLHFGPKVYVFT